MAPNAHQVSRFSTPTSLARPVRTVSHPPSVVSVYVALRHAGIDHRGIGKHATPGDRGRHRPRAVLAASAALVTTVAGADADTRVPLSIRVGDRALQDGALTAWIVGALVYFVVCEWFDGRDTRQGVGRAARPHADGRCCTFSAALVRNVMRLVDAFPFGIPNLVGLIAVAGTRRHQRLGDLAAQTIVVRSR